MILNKHCVNSFSEKSQSERQSLSLLLAFQLTFNFHFKFFLNNSTLLFNMLAYMHMDNINIIDLLYTFSTPLAFTLPP